MDVSNVDFSDSNVLHTLKTYQVGAIEAGAHRALRQHKDALLKNYGMTGMDWYIIGNVADAGPEGIRSTDLAKTLGTTLGFLTKSINLLEAKGILIRKANAQDARSHYIALNKSYQKTVDEIEHELRDHLRKSIYSLVTPEELITYIKVMEKFNHL